MKKLTTLIVFGLACSFSSFAFQNMDQVEIKTQQITEEVYLLQGAGGNIGILTGPDGVFMIDDQFAALSDKLIAAIAKISEQPVRFLVNTHHHGDHTGGNENFDDQGALILAHENVRERLKEKATDSTAGIPVITFNDQLNLHINANDVMVLHVHNAHTDGDALVYLPQSNVLHTGDTFFNGMFPYIDLSSGGSVDGDIEAAEKGLSIINEKTKIIPGHGDLANYQDYSNYVSMLKNIRENVQQKIDQGATEEEIALDESLTSEFYTDKEASEFFINGEKIRRTFYKSLKK
ncbi:glyoxylase-like metal-dependent hydrolase (beta-lactamase superfamily II) [Gramella sp. Hel_I_59]|uniref:MBL fold metallo-hydrolase n=1 Tax=Gramella sp. Hel_I_59 TaxID=1249978 RepID=UPI001150F0E0|nr:MBL fold metallo-hydrolase [Gramella sp. Hel_I_59]TQI70093.1 glyoxylase-like metal-dependent hydrolase (beta-lactamase superfamily II) [Gramella sp. Hel_I_59]